MSASKETNAWDDIKFGTTSIEHGTASLTRRSNRGGRNFRQITTTTTRSTGSGMRPAVARGELGRLTKVLDGMVEKGVAWDPTLVIYEASRDLQRAQTQPAFAEYLHPVLEEYFRPNPANHGFVLYRLEFDRRNLLEGELSHLDEGGL
jgi:hypothetical protein